MSGRLNLRELASSVAQLREELRRCQREVEALRGENEVLREAAAPLIHEVPARDRFAFMHRRRARFGVNVLCRVLAVDQGNYYSWIRRQGRRRDREFEDQRLTELILEVHAAHPAYGAPRVMRGLQRLGIPVGRRVVARLMRQNGISGVTRRRRNLTKADAGAVPDLIRWDFTAPMPGLKLVGDISCFPTGEGWLYLATAVDLCSKEVVGYAVAPHMRASLAIEAITAPIEPGWWLGTRSCIRTVAVKACEGLPQHAAAPGDPAEH